MLRISGNVTKLLEKLLNCTLLTTKCRITLSSLPQANSNNMIILLPFQSNLEEALACYDYLESMYNRLRNITDLIATKIGHNILQIDVRPEDRETLFETIQIMIEEGPWKNIVPSLILNTYCGGEALVMDFSFFLEKDSDILALDKLNIPFIKKLKNRGFNFDHIIFAESSSEEVKRASLKLVKLAQTWSINNLTPDEVFSQIQRLESQVKEVQLTQDIYAILNIEENLDLEKWVETRQQDNQAVERYTIEELTSSPWFRRSPLLVRKKPKISFLFSMKKLLNLPTASTSFDFNQLGRSRTSPKAISTSSSSLPDFNQLSDVAKQDLVRNYKQDEPTPSSSTNTEPELSEYPSLLNEEEPAYFEELPQSYPTGQPSFSEQRGQQGQQLYQGQPSFPPLPEQQGQPSFSEQQGQPSFPEQQGQQGQPSFPEQQGQQHPPSFSEQPRQQGQPSFSEQPGQPSFSEQQGQQGQSPFQSETVLTRNEVNALLHTDIAELDKLPDHLPRDTTPFQTEDTTLPAFLQETSYTIFNQRRAEDQALRSTVTRNIQPNQNFEQQEFTPNPTNFEPQESEWQPPSPSLNNTPLLSKEEIDLLTSKENPHVWKKRLDRVDPNIGRVLTPVNPVVQQNGHLIEQPSNQNPFQPARPATNPLPNSQPSLLERQNALLQNLRALS